MKILNWLKITIEKWWYYYTQSNAPTAIYEDLSIIEEIIAKNQDVVVIIDEAYIDFGGRSLGLYPNMIIFWWCVPFQNPFYGRDSYGYAIGSKS